MLDLRGECMGCHHCVVDEEGKPVNEDWEKSDRSAYNRCGYGVRKIKP
jgi:hypothetical protein